MYKIQNYRYADAYEEDRYIIVDTEGFDVCGEHYSLDEALEICNEMNKELEIMKTFRIESSHSVYMDDYEQGEGAQVTSYEMDGIIKAETPLQAIEKYMETVVGYDFCIEESIIEDDVLLYSVLVDGSIIQASDKQIESWKQGKCILYADQFSIVIYELNKVSL